MKTQHNDQIISKDLWLDIPSRTHSSSAKIFVKIVAQNKESLAVKPYVFILPGGPGANHAHYADYSCLSTHANIVFHDPRGCGQSSQDDPMNYTMENYIDDIEVIRQLLQLKKVILLGKSCGAMAAVGFILRYPDSVSQLILAAGAASFKFIETAKTNVLKQGSAQQQAVCETLWQGSFGSHDEVNDFFKRTASLYSYKVKHGLSFTPQSPSPYPFSYECLNRGFGDFLREFNFEEQLHLIQSSTLILVGEEDWITDKSHSQLMAEKIPNSRLIIFSKANHKMEIDVPELYFNAIKEFIFAQ